MFLRLTMLVLSLAFVADVYGAVSDDLRDEDIEIVEGEDRVIYEYRTNGLLMIIKVVPKRGRPYYMVPADGSPHYRNLDHVRSLYPQWVIVEF